MKLENKQKVAVAESLFQEHWKAKDWLKIWYDVEFVCSNIVKGETHGFFRDDLDEIVDAATVKCYARLKKRSEETINNLCNFCFLTAYFEIHNPKRQFEERITYCDDLLSNRDEVVEDETELREKQKQFYEKLKTNMEICTSFSINCPKWLKIDSAENDGWKFVRVGEVLNVERVD